MHEKPDHLEYNDGVGDLLREKERHPFSWVKTLTTMGALLILVVLGLILAFMAGKVLFSNTRATHPSAVEEKLTPVESEVPAVKSPVVPSAAVPVKEVEAPSPSPAPAPKKPVVKKTVAVAAKPAPVAKPVTVAKPVPSAAAQSKQVPLPIVSEPTHPVSPAVFSYKLVAGKFADPVQAKALVKSLSDKGISAFTWVEKTPSATMVVVQVGAFDTQAKAAEAVKRFEKKGLSLSVIKR